MALRYRCELDNISVAATVTWRVDIHDAEFSGGVLVEFDALANGLRIFDQDSGEDDITWISTRNVELSFYIKNATDQGFLDDMSESGDHRFVVEVYRDGVRDFVGKLLPELSRWSDEFYPRAATITATCGLGLLKEISYYFSRGQNIFQQLGDGVFRAEVSSAITIETGPTPNTENFWDVVPTNRGGHFDILTGAYGREGTIDFDAHLNLLITADRVVIGLVLPVVTTVQLIKNSVGSQTVLDEWSYEHKDLSTARKSVDLKARGLEIGASDKVSVSVEYNYQEGNVKVDIGSSFSNKVTDRVRSYNNVFAPTITHLVNAIKLIGLDDFYPGAVLETHNSWRSGTVSTDFLFEKTGISYNAWVTNFSDSPVQVVSAWDVLEQICKRFVARMIYRNGLFLFQQYSALGEASGTDTSTAKRQYNIDGVYSGAGTAFASSAAARVGVGSEFAHRAPIARVDIDFTRLLTEDILDPARNLEPNTEIDIEFIGRTYRLRYKCVVSVDDFVVGGGIDDSPRLVWRMKLKIGSKWAKVVNLNDDSRDEVVYSVPEWSDTESYIEIWSEILDTGVVGLTPQTFKVDVDFEFPAMEDDANLTYSNQLWKALEQNTDHDFTSRTDYVIDEDTLAYIDKDGSEVLEETYRTRADLERDGSQTMTMPLLISDNTRHTDDPGQLGYYDGSEWIDCPKDWQHRYYKGDTDEMVTEVAGDIDTLTAWSVMKHRTRAVTSFEGLFIGHLAYDQFKTITLRGAPRLLIYIGGSYDARMDEATGEWLEFIIGDSYTKANYTRSVLSEERSSRTGSLPGSSSGSVQGTTTTIIQGERELIETIPNVTGTSVTPAILPPPDPDLIGWDEFNRLYRIYRQGVLQDGPEDFTVVAGTITPHAGYGFLDEKIKIISKVK